MSLKQLIRFKKLAQSCASNMLVLPGEPMIYSCKSEIVGRSLSGQYLRNVKWTSFLKCYFPAYMNPKTPVVVIVKFFVSPPDREDIDPAAVKAERPAIMAHEICEYLLSFLEMLHRALYNTYRQMVHVEASKHYSENPRTEMQYMSYDTYVSLQNNHTVDTKAKSKRKAKGNQSVQSECTGNAQDAPTG